MIPHPPVILGGSFVEIAKLQDSPPFRPGGFRKDLWLSI